MSPYDLMSISVVTVEFGEANSLGLQIHNCYPPPAESLEESLKAEH